MPRTKRLPRLMATLLGAMALLAALVFWPSHRAASLPPAPFAPVAPFKPEIAGQPEAALGLGHHTVAALSPIKRSIPMPSALSQPGLASRAEPTFPDEIATPGTLLLFASGLFGLAICRRRKTADKEQFQPEA